MKRILKAIGGFLVVMAAVCALTTSVQARTFVSFGFGFPIYGPAYYPGYCYAPAPAYYYARPVYYCAPPAYYYSRGVYYRCR